MTELEKTAIPFYKFENNKMVLNGYYINLLTKYNSLDDILNDKDFAHLLK